MSVLGLGFSIYLRTVDRWLRLAGDDPAGSQRRVLRRLLNRAQNTWFARRHDFASIRSHADFAQAVPVSDYAGGLGMFQRILAGEPDVAWPGKIKFFAQTSGTTAGQKYIPVTPEMMRSNRRAALAMFASYARWGRGSVGRLWKGQLLFLGGSTNLKQIPGGAMVGDLSAIATRSIRWPLKRHCEPERELALIEEWEEKLARVAESLAFRDVRFVTGMPSWVKLLFDRVCEVRNFQPEGGISRAWPNLQLFVHGGVNFAPYRTAFRKFFTKEHLRRLDFLEVYPASEGFIAIQAEAEKPDMTLLTDNGLFFEFVPLSRWRHKNAPRLTIDQVEPDVPYSVVLSTCAGLWAYDLGDVVRFTSLKPPQVVFAGRNRHFINAFGENIISEQVVSAVAEAADATGAEVAGFSVAPAYPDKTRYTGGHEYVVEFRRLPAAGLEAFADAVDAHLQRLNHDYSVKRRGDLGMTRVQTTPVPAGTFYKWMKRNGKLGGQHKVPVCANDRRYVDDLLASVKDYQPDS
ncbi:MAG: GH3 auxin-responsive promoter family protein [Planctomycetota bacterium]|nr:GH3 auxin-responsive promoter family protein [Planctomycetota bacterium]